MTNAIEEQQPRTATTTSKQERILQLQKKVIDDLSSTENEDEEDSSSLVRMVSAQKIIGVDTYDDNDIIKLDCGVCNNATEYSSPQKKNETNRKSSQYQKQYWQFLNAICMSCLIAIVIGSLVGLLTMSIETLRKHRVNKSSSSSIQPSKTMNDNDFNGTITIDSAHSKNSTTTTATTNTGSSSSSKDALIDTNKSSWPELLDMDLQIAISVIQSERPDITIIYIISDYDHSMQSLTNRTDYEPDFYFEYHSDRIILHIDENGYITQMPVIG